MPPLLGADGTLGTLGAGAGALRRAPPEEPELLRLREYEYVRFPPDEEEPELPLDFLRAFAFACA